MLAGRGVATPARLEFLGVTAGADYLDVIVRAGDEDVAVQALARWLETEQPALHLDHLPPSPAAARLREELERSGWTAIESSPDVCPFIELSGQSWDSYLSSVGSSHRANVRRRLRALESRFDVRFTPVVSDEARRRALDGLFAFHDQRWASCGGSSAFCTAALRAFHHDLTRSALAGGWLRMYALSLDGTLVGTMYGFARHGRVYFFQHGSDAAYAGYSLGIVLMAMTVRAAISEGMREFDLLYGHEAYKKLWTRRERPLGRLALFPPRLLGRWLQRRAETRQAVRALVHRLGLKGSHDAA
jgi:CelD/BcsL family acetyltransferase involved in cellulose biosynthesis